jgi:hypothetical protein
MTLHLEVKTRLRDFPLYSQEAQSDPVVHCKLFHAYGNGTWYLTEYDGQDIAFGYVTGLADAEWGYVSILELAALRLCGDIPRIECDKYFIPVPFSKLRI